MHQPEVQADSTGVPAASTPSRATIVLLGLLLAALCGLAYSNAFSGMFAGLDAKESIRDNPHIRSLWPLTEAMSLPLLASTKAADAGSKGGTVVRRPVLSLSFALNWALLGPNPNRFHAVNLAIHIVAAWLLFGIVRRTLVLPRLRPHYGKAATALAFSIAAIWALHPVQTESVTYIVQRAESLMGMLFLLTFYCVVRALDSGHASVWRVAAVVACAFGMGTKEVTAVLPVLVVAYDGIFGFASYREALRRRWTLYAALAATWAVIIVLVAITLSDVRSDFNEGRNLAYALSQPSVILHYLRLAVWPYPLYVYVNTNLFTVRTAADVLLPLAVVGPLVAGTVWGLWRRSPLGFLGAWFFLILAPTSTFVAVSDVIQEHRMYLSLAAVVVIAVCGFYRLLQRARAHGLPQVVAKTLAVNVLVAVVVACAIATHARNEDYHSEFGMIRPEDMSEAFQILANHYLLGPIPPQAARTEAETMLASPNAGPADLAFAEYLLGLLALEDEQPHEAQAHFQRAVARYPDSVLAHNRLGVALLDQGQVAAAANVLRETVERWPNDAASVVSLGRVLLAQEDLVGAQAQFERALTLDRNSAVAYNNLAYVLEARGDLAAAEASYRKAMSLDPEMELARNNLGELLLRQDRIEEARVQFEVVLAARPDDVFAMSRLALIEEHAGAPQNLLRAIELFRGVLAVEPNDARMHARLAGVLDRLGEAGSAQGEYARALELDPDLTGARTALATLLARQGRLEEAIAEFERVLRIEPDNVGAHANLGAALASVGRREDAAVQLESVLRLAPSMPLAHFNLALLYEEQGALEQARLHYEQEIALNPGLAAAHNNLGRTLEALGRPADAAAAYAKAVELDPGYVEAARNLARTNPSGAP